MYHTVFPYRGKLRFGHFQLQVESQDLESLTRLELDFNACSKHLPQEGHQSTHTLKLIQHTHSEKPRGIFKFRDWRANSLGSRRTIYYKDGSVVLTDRDKSITQVFSTNSYRLHELAYLFTLSWLGEELDSLGFHRVHGLGISYSNSTALFVMDSGTGKSTLALSLKKYLPLGAFKIFSDEIPLLKDNQLHAFPIRAAFSENTLSLLMHDKSGLPQFTRMGFSTKRLMGLEEIAPIAPPSRVTHFIFCTRNSKIKAPIVRKLSKAAAFIQILKASVIGIGVPQMTEHFLRLNFKNLFRLTKISFSRMYQAMRLVISTPTYHFTLSHLTNENVAAVKVLLSHVSVQTVSDIRVRKKAFLSSTANGGLHIVESNPSLHQPESN